MYEELKEVLTREKKTRNNLGSFIYRANQINGVKLTTLFYLLDIPLHSSLAVSLLLENLCASTKPGYTASIELGGSEYEPALAHRFEQKRDCTVYILHIIIQTP